MPGGGGRSRSCQTSSSSTPHERLGMRRAFSITLPVRCRLGACSGAYGDGLQAPTAPRRARRARQSRRSATSLPPARARSSAGTDPERSPRPDALASGLRGAAAASTRFVVPISAGRRMAPHSPTRGCDHRIGARGPERWRTSRRTRSGRAVWIDSSSRRRRGPCHSTAVAASDASMRYDRPLSRPASCGTASRRASPGSVGQVVAVAAGRDVSGRETQELRDTLSVTAGAIHAVRQNKLRTGGSRQRCDTPGSTPRTRGSR